MSRGEGRIEQAILAAIERQKAGPRARSVHMMAGSLAYYCYRPADSGWGWEPTMAQQKSILRALHSFVRKHPEFALMGGQGRKRLYLYEPGDPISALWAKLSIERREPLPWIEVIRVAAASDRPVTRCDGSEPAAKCVR